MGPKRNTQIPLPVAVSFSVPERTAVVQLGELRVPERVRAVATLEQHGLDVSLSLVVEDGIYAVDELVLRRRSGGRSLNQSRLREDLPVQDLVDACATLLDARIADELGQRVQWDALASPRRTGRRWAVTDEHLREVAEVYRSGHPRGTEAVMHRFEPVSHRTASRWVSLARERGYLPPATKGKGTV